MTKNVFLVLEIVIALEVVLVGENLEVLTQSVFGVKESSAPCPKIYRPLPHQPEGVEGEPAPHPEQAGCLLGLAEL